MPRVRGWSRWTARAAAVIATAALAAGTLGAVPAHAADGDFEFTLNGDGKAVITGFVTGVTGVTDLVIPATVSEGEDAYEVAEIGASAFYNNTEITSLTMPEGLAAIGSNAFRGTPITSVTIPSTVSSLGSGSFSGTSALATLAFAGETSLTTIPQEAFARSGLTSVTIPEGITSIGATAFFNSQLSTVTLPAGLTTIGASAFNGNQLTTLDLPAGTTTIGDEAFRNNQLASVAIPASVTALGEYVFRGNALTAVTFAEGSSLTTIPPYAFLQNVLTDVDLPPSVTEIGMGAFYGNEFETLVLPASVTTVGFSAFGDNALTAVTIEGDGVSLAGKAFGRNSSKGSETGFRTVTFDGTPPSEISPVDEDERPSFYTHDAEGTVESTPTVVYQEEYGEAAGYAGGFTTPTWQGYTAGPADAVLPPTPTRPTVSVDGQTVTVSWTTPEGGAPVTGHKVRISPVSDTAVEQVHDDLLADATSTVFENVAGGSYQAYVTAKSEAGDSESQPSNGFPVVATTVPGTPAAPEILEVDGQDATIRLRKLHVTGGQDITGYTLRLAPASGEPVLETFPVDELDFREIGAGSDNYLAADVTVTDLAPGTYTASVYATNAIGDGPPSPSTPEFTIEADSDPTQQVAAEIEAGEKIVVSGTGWKTTDGTKGSIIGLKLDTGTVTRTFDLTWPEDTTANDATKANRTIWGVVQADASGAWSVELPYPTPANSDADLSGWTDGSTHTVQVLSGSLLTGDAQRSVPLSFTVTGTLPDTAVDTTVTADAVKQVYGKTAKLLVTVSPDATGEVSVKAGSKTITGTLTDGKVKLTLPAKALKPGRRNLTVSYAGVEGQFKPSTGKAKVTVAKAKPTVKVKAPAKVKRGKTATITVTVAAAGVKPSGKVTVKIAGTKKTTATLRNGKAVAKLKLPKGLKPGKKKVVATYQGDTYVAKTKAKATTISVTR